MGDDPYRAPAAVAPEATTFDHLLAHARLRRHAAGALADAAAGPAPGRARRRTLGERAKLVVAILVVPVPAALVVAPVLLAPKVGPVASDGVAAGILAVDVMRAWRPATQG